ncbi:MAG: proprotein convertase P-domain-containing protein [Anaerolineae bacterium]
MTRILRFAAPIIAACVLLLIVTLALVKSPAVRAAAKSEAQGTHRASHTPALAPQADLLPPQIYTDTTPLVIPDNVCDAGVGSYVTSTINVPTSFVINDLNVGVNLDHTWRTDLSLQLRGPDGTTVVLHPATNPPPPPILNFDILWDDESSNGVVTSTSHITTTPFYENDHTPANSLSAFDNKNAAGDWQLGICDDNANDTGRLNMWTLFFEPLSVDLSKSAAPDPAAAGQVLTYTVVAENNGAASLLGVVITDALDSNVTFISASDSGVHSNGVVTWTLSGMIVGQRITRTIAVTVSNVASGTLLSNTAWFSSSQGVTDVATTTTTVIVQDIVLSISKSGPATANPGEQVTYTLTVTNDGDTEAQNLVVTDTLPAGANYVSGSGGTLVGNEVRWNISSLAARGGTSQHTFAVTASATITNSEYGVRAGSGQSASGSVPVVTSIGGGSTTVYLPLTVKSYTLGTCASNVADIRATDITVTDQATSGAPVANQPANVSITIENCGGQDATTQYFWVDLYINPDEGSSLWPISQNELYFNFGQGASYFEVLTAGQSKTQVLTATFPAGTHKLYVQVDSFNDATSYGVVNEGTGGETNNVFGPVEVSVGGASVEVGQSGGQIRIGPGSAPVDSSAPGPLPAPSRPDK